LHVPTSVALYLLNYKRKALADVETRYETIIIIENDDTLIPPDCRIERSEDVITHELPKLPPINNRSSKNLNAEEDAEDAEDAEDNEDAEDAEDNEGGKRRKRRRGRRRKRSDNEDTETAETGTEKNDGSENGDKEESASSDESEEGQIKRRRRGRRGGRNRGRKPENNAQTKDFEGAEGGVNLDASNDPPERNEAESFTPAITQKDKTSEISVEPKPRRRRRKATNSAAGDTAVIQVIPIASMEQELTSVTEQANKILETEATLETPKKPVSKPRRKTVKAKAEISESVEVGPSESVLAEKEAEPPKPKRRRRSKAVVEDTPVVVANIKILPPEKSALEATSAAGPEEKPGQLAEIKSKSELADVSEPEPAAKEKTVKKGWWRR
jgi:ribonuclease E